MSETEKAYNNVVYLIYVLVAVAIVLTFLGAPNWFFSFVVGLFTSAISGAVISVCVTALVERTTGDLLKGYLIEVEILGYGFSISLFVIATIIVRLWLFH